MVTTKKLHIHKRLCHSARGPEIPVDQQEARSKLKCNTAMKSTG